MAQIQAGITYADGAQVNATNLNAHVNNAVLVPGVISTQAAATSCTAGDSLLILQSGALKQATLAQVQAAIPPVRCASLIPLTSSVMPHVAALAIA